MIFLTRYKISFHITIIKLSVFELYDCKYKKKYSRRNLIIEIIIALFMKYIDVLSLV